MCCGHPPTDKQMLSDLGCALISSSGSRLEYDLDLIFEHFADHTDCPKDPAEVVSELRQLMKAATDVDAFPKITYDGAELVLGVSDV